MKTSDFLAFKVKHETALSDLRSYALDSQDDADRLNPVLHAKDFAAMVEAAPILNRYLACSIFIDELYQALISAAVERDNDGLPDDSDPQDPRTHSLASREVHEERESDIPSMDRPEDY